MDKLIEFSELKHQKKFVRPRMDAERLEEFLAKPPPTLEFVSLIEIYKLDEKGKRKRRVCGQPTNYRLPTFVPVGVENPHNVINPRQEYRCGQAAGKGTNHLGLGPCNRHSHYMYTTFRGHKFSKSYNLHSQFNEMIRNEFLKGESMDEGAIAKGKELGLEGGIDMDAYVEKVKGQLSAEELYDVTRPLYELEATKEALKDLMRGEGMTADRLEQYANQILKTADFQAKMAKRDADLMQASATQAITKVMITGILGIVAEEIDEDRAVAILRRIKEELVLPTGKQGATEMLRRQQAAGVTDRISSLAERAEEAEFIEVGT